MSDYDNEINPGYLPVGKIVSLDTNKAIVRLVAEKEKAIHIAAEYKHALVRIDEMHRPENGECPICRKKWPCYTASVIMAALKQKE